MADGRQNPDLGLRVEVSARLYWEPMRHQRHNRRVWVETLLQPWPALPIGALVLLAGSFLYVWLRVEPVLEYHSYGRYFYRQRAFLETFLGHPGGLASYAGVFLAQLNCFNWLGALVFVLSECVVFLTTLVCLARINGRAPGFVALVPVFAFLLLRNCCGCPVVVMSAGFLLALAASAAHLSASWRRAWLSMVVSGLISGLLFYLAGLWNALLFAVLCCLFVIFQMRNCPAGLASLVPALAVPLVAIRAGNLTISGLVDAFPEGVDRIPAAAFYASVPVMAAVLALLAKAAGASSANVPSVTQETATPAPRLGRWFEIPRRGQVVVVLAFLLGGATVWLSFDRRQKLLAEIDYHASRGEYEEVLAAARQVKVLDHPAKVRLLLALYHTGQLAETLFSFHNMIDEAPFERAGEDYRAQSQSLLELGLINDAEHAAHEALELQGDRPDLLRLLARVNLVKNRPQAAQIFLNVLSRIPFQGQRANNSWPAMDPQMPATDLAFLTGLRARMLTNDVVHDGLPVGRLLGVLLAANPTNRMAFEYVMAYHLLDLEVKEAVERLRLLDNFNYAQMPRPYEEALLLFQQAAGVRVELNGRAIRPETVERFRQFTEAVLRLKGSAEEQAALAARFGDTYWYYFYGARSRKLAAEGQAPGP